MSPIRTQRSSRLASFRSELETLMSRARRREVAVFTAGLLLFAAGSANLIVTQLRATNSVNIADNDGTSAQSVNIIGRPSDEAVSAYIARKKSLLASRAKKDATASSHAVISFDSYRKAEEVQSFLETGKVTPRVAMLRVAIEGYAAEQVPIDERGAAGLAARSKARADQESAIATELESLVSSVSEPSFKSVYLEDAARRRRAAEVLLGGAVWFAVVVEGPLSELAALGKSPGAKGVRLVDIPEEPNVTIATHSFRGILPEES